MPDRPTPLDGNQPAVITVEDTDGTPEQSLRVCTFDGITYTYDFLNRLTGTDYSTGASAYLWDFGDGVTSTLENPTHTYVAASVYTVSLTATGPGGSDTLARTNYITVYEPVVADFTAVPLSGHAPLHMPPPDSNGGSPGHKKGSRDR